MGTTTLAFKLNREFRTLVKDGVLRSSEYRRWPSASDMRQKRIEPPVTIIGPRQEKLKKFEVIGFVFCSAGMIGEKLLKEFRVLR